MSYIKGNKTKTLASIAVMKQILSILMAIVFLAGNVGFTLATHYCGGEIHKQSLEFSTNDLSCRMDNSNEAPCEQKEDAVHRNCCQNEFQNFRITDEFQAATDELEPDFQFAVTFAADYMQLLSSEKEQHAEYRNYRPPTLKKDIPVLVGSFLI